MLPSMVIKRQLAITMTIGAVCIKAWHCLQGFPAQAIANILWAYATLGGGADPRFLRDMCEAAKLHLYMFEGQVNGGAALLPQVVRNNPVIPQSVCFKIVDPALSLPNAARPPVPAITGNCQCDLGASCARPQGRRAAGRRGSRTEAAALRMRSPAFGKHCVGFCKTECVTPPIMTARRQRGDDNGRCMTVSDTLMPYAQGTSLKKGFCMPSPAVHSSGSRSSSLKRSRC